MTYFPDIPPSRTTKLHVSQPVKSHRFGDGHVRYLKLGVMRPEREWSLRWTALPKSDADQIEAFLSGAGAGGIFSWTPPGESSGMKFICTTWSLTPQTSGHCDIDAVFAEYH